MPYVIKIHRRSALHILIQNVQVDLNVTAPSKVTITDIVTQHWLL